MPTSPVSKAAVSTSLAGDHPEFAAKLALRRTASMKITATTPKIGPINSAIGRSDAMSAVTPSMVNRRELPNIWSLNQAALTLATAIGAMARIEKWRRIASCANTIPAMGALNPAAIAPATPQPMKTSVVSAPPVTCRRKLPIVAPKCTSGPY